MKKRMTLPAMLVCLVFLILGSSGTLQAQQMMESMPAFQVSNSGDSKTPIVFLGGTAAYQATRTEIQANYSGTLPDQNTVPNATVVFKHRYLVLVQSHLEKGASVGSAIFDGYAELLALSSDFWPGLVNDSWRNEMITLLSN